MLNHFEKLKKINWPTSNVAVSSLAKPQNKKIATEQHQNIIIHPRSTLQLHISSPTKSKIQNYHQTNPNHPEPNQLLKAHKSSRNFYADENFHPQFSVISININVNLLQYRSNFSALTLTRAVPFSLSFFLSRRCHFLPFSRSSALTFTVIACLLLLMELFYAP
jgi:hypothetical protein